MNDGDSLTEARQWLRYAREDLAAAEAMSMEQTVPARIICWLAQQAAEKAIKSALVFLAIDFPKTHDLDALRNLLPGGWDLTRTSEDLAELTEWSVEARYPGDWPEATGADALRALAKAKAVLQSVTDNLRKLDNQ